MAVLIQDDAQLKALEEINQMLEELRAINTAIQGQGPYILRVNKRQSIIIEEKRVWLMISDDDALLACIRLLYIDPHCPFTSPLRCGFHVILCLCGKHLRIYPVLPVHKFIVGTVFLYGLVRKYRDMIAEPAA